VAFGETLHPAFRRELRRLAARGVPPAEALRRLIPVAARVDLPRPSYATVRRVLKEEAAAVARARERRERVLAQVLAGRVPRPKDFEL